MPLTRRQRSADPCRGCVLAEEPDGAWRAGALGTPGCVERG